MPKNILSLEELQSALCTLEKLSPKSCQPLLKKLEKLKEKHCHCGRPYCSANEHQEAIEDVCSGCHKYSGYCACKKITPKFEIKVEVRK